MQLENEGEMVIGLCKEDLGEIAPNLVVVAHEINRQICLLNGEEARSYKEMSEDIIESMERAIVDLKKGRNLGDSHTEWFKERTAQGWTYGPVKDMDKKISPCLVPFEELPYNQKVKDCIFVGIKNALDILGE